MATLRTEPFGQTRDGQAVTLVTMASGQGVLVQFMSYGGIITKIMTPDRSGNGAGIVLGFSTLEEYETKSAQGGLYFGALIGRYANRIAGGRFTLNGKMFQLALTDPPNSLHGGVQGFDKRNWQIRPLVTQGHCISAELHYVSADGEEGFPGKLDVTVTYSLNEDNQFTVRYMATTDSDTVLNLTNHSYFNLAGAGSKDGVLNHVLTINADHFLPTDATAIPTGEIVPVENTPFDFRQPVPIGARIHSDHPQLLIARGYDQNWVLNKDDGVRDPSFAARLVDPGSGRMLECYTTQPGLQVYTANSLDGTYAGIGGAFRQTDAVALETQHFPDSPNHPRFPTTELKPDQRFESVTTFRFGICGST